MIWSGPLSAAIGYAVSDDGIHWERPLAHPVLRPDKPWENHIIWTPHVIYDEEEDLFKMWYAGRRNRRHRVRRSGICDQ